MYLFYFIMINSCITLSPNGKTHANPADIGKKISPIPVIDRVIEFDVASILTIVSFDSNDSKIVFSVLSFIYFLFDLWVLF